MHLLSLTHTQHTRTRTHTHAHTHICARPHAHIVSDHEPADRQAEEDGQGDAGTTRGLGCDSHDDHAGACNSVTLCMGGVCVCVCVLLLEGFYKRLVCCYLSRVCTVCIHNRQDSFVEKETQPTFKNHKPHIPQTTLVPLSLSLSPSLPPYLLPYSLTQLSFASSLSSFSNVNLTPSTPSFPPSPSTPPPPSATRSYPTCPRTYSRPSPGPRSHSTSLSFNLALIRLEPCRTQT